MRIVLKGGYYDARSQIADSQRCLNLYPEVNAGDSPDPVTHYPTPGLKLRAVAPNNAPERGRYTASNGSMYAVHGSTLYAVSANNVFTVVGVISGINQVSMVDNGTTMIVVNGPAGYRVSINTNHFEIINDEGFYGADVVAFVDGYFVLNWPGTRQFYISDVEAATFLQTPNFASKEAAGDPLVTLAVVHREIWLFGSETTEIYFDSGDPDFPFQIMPGVFIQHGCAAKYSVSQFDSFTLWLGQEPQGKCVVYMGVNYQADRISTHPIENVISQYSVVSDAIGGMYQIEGHPTYVLTFPTADATWAFDLATKKWHEWAYMSDDGLLHRVLPNCFTAAYGATIVGDSTNGNMYELDPYTFDDNGAAILRLRSFPTFDDDRRIKFDKLTLDVATGVGLENSVWEDPTVNIRWSDNSGKSWGEYVQLSLGIEADFLVCPVLWNMGIGRRRVYEVSWSSPLNTALNGAWIDYKKLAS